MEYPSLWETLRYELSRLLKDKQFVAGAAGFIAGGIAGFWAGKNPDEALLLLWIPAVFVGVTVILSVLGAAWAVLAHLYQKMAGDSKDESPEAESQ